jgi:hypothetical protein
MLEIYKNRIFLQLLKFIMSDGLTQAVGHNTSLCPMASIGRRT